MRTRTGGVAGAQPPAAFFEPSGFQRRRSEPSRYLNSRLSEQYCASRRDELLAPSRIGRAESKPRVKFAEAGRLGQQPGRLRYPGQGAPSQAPLTYPPTAWYFFTPSRQSVWATADITSTQNAWIANPSHSRGPCTRSMKICTGKKSW